MSRPSRRTRAAAFTLIELLVVISIIALLTAILIPTLSRAREQVRSVACRSQMKQVVHGMQYYVADYQVLPGTHSLFYFQTLFGHGAWTRPPGVTWDGAEDRLVGLDYIPTYSKPYHQDAQFCADVPGRGTIFRYLRDPDVYVCPGDRPGSANGTPLGGGGNGRLSYSLNAFVGYRSPDHLQSFQFVAASTGNPLPGTSETRSFAAGERVNIPASRFMMLFEEHPNFFINNQYPDGNFNGLDRIATRHMLASDANGQNPTGKTSTAFLDGHAESPTFPALTEGRELFTKMGQPHFWRREGDPDTANISAFLKNLGAVCPW